MNFLETFDLRISTLSPVHVGCGEDYEPTHYVIDQKRLYTFDPVLLMRSLPLAQREKFASLVENGNGQQVLQAVQNFFYRHKAAAIEVGRYCAQVNPTVQNFYDNRIGNVTQREQGGRNVLNKLEIARTAYNPVSGHPILPGSSLKGAIRTALLESLRQGKTFRNPKGMEADILGGSFSTDPLRFLKVSDATFRPKIKVKNKEGEIREVERHAMIRFQANRKKRPNQFQTRGNINTLLECLPEAANLFSTQFVIENKVRQGDKTPDLQLDFTTVADACNGFYLERLKAEGAILQSNRYAAEWVEKLENSLAPGGARYEIIQEKQGFLLRVGRHSGAESVTVDAPRNIKIMKGQGNPATWEKEATTLWLAAEDKDQQENLRPFGWVFVQLVPGKA